MHRFRWLICGALAILLAGCVPSSSSRTQVAEPAQATAPTLQAAAPAPVAQAAVPQATPAQPTAEERRVHTLIQQVESAYKAGENNYRKGQLAEAKAEFDRAVDLMLASGIDIKSDPQLQQEFDHVIDEVNGLEMEALKLGNGFVPKEEETPAEVASDVTFEVDPNVVARAKANLATTKSDLPLVVNDYVAAYINFFANTQKGHNTLLHSFQRGGRYRAMIQRVMAEEGVPQDLIYLAVAESGFNPRAIGPRTRSGGKAGGMWQFMPVGEYGLRRTPYMDERFDPEKSTRAYARYMKFLYDQLGDWYLAMAAYDWGAGNVQRAVQKTGYADYWELYKRNNLPGETKSYVPEILAAIIIANNPHQYGFDDITLDPPVITDTVTINYPIDMRLVSDLVDAPIDEVMALNPSLLRMSTPPDTAFDLHLPAGTATVFEDRVNLIPEARRVSWRYHRVTQDDTLASVAREYRVSPAELAAANQISQSESIANIEALVVPVAPVAAPSSRTTIYTARRGDTLVTIADRFGVSLEQLRRWNQMTGTKVEPGKRLHVAEPARVVRASGGSRHKGTASTARAHATAPAGASPKAHGTASGKSGAAKPAAQKKTAPAAGSHHARQAAAITGSATH